MSYLELRKSLGIIGIALPFVLAGGKIFLDDPGILDSISAYYYSVMGNVFVGSLCAIAVFLFSYRGYSHTDTVVAKIAALSALGTAFFPTAPSQYPTAPQILIGYFHFFCAITLFMLLAYFALILFRKTSATKPPTPQKLQRNIVYSVCGYIMLLCVAGIIAIEFLPRDNTIWDYAPIFWLESTAIISFGISWLVKGEAILKDIH